MALHSDMDLFHGEEGAQLKAFLDERDDARAVAVYLAFLDARDPGRAEVLRAAQRPKLAASMAEAERENARVTALVEGLHGPRRTWWHLVKDPGDVRSCGAAKREEPRVRFVFACPKTWSSLTPTADPKVRDCPICNEQVFRCETPGEVSRRARLGQCIAVPRDLAARA